MPRGSAHKEYRWPQDRAQHDADCARFYEVIELEKRQTRESSFLTRSRSKRMASIFELKGHWDRLYSEQNADGSVLRKTVERKILVLILRQLCLITLWLVGIFAAICVSIFV